MNVKQNTRSGRTTYHRCFEAPRNEPPSPKKADPWPKPPAHKESRYSHGTHAVEIGVMRRQAFSVCGPARQSSSLFPGFDIRTTSFAATLSLGSRVRLARRKVSYRDRRQPLGRSGQSRQPTSLAHPRPFTVALCPQQGRAEPHRLGHRP